MIAKKPSLTADGILIENNRILLIQRKNEPFKGKWALPGGFVEFGEKTEDTVIREFYEETGLKTKIRDLIGVYSDPGRDPRGHTITIAYFLVKKGGKLVLSCTSVPATKRYFKYRLPDELFEDEEPVVLLSGKHIYLHKGDEGNGIKKIEIILESEEITV